MPLHSFMRRRALRLCFILVFVPAFLAADPSFGFNLSPNEQGQLEPSLSAAWDWNERFGARLSFESDNSTDYSESIDGDAASFTTMNQNMSASLDPLVYRINTGPVSASIGAGLGGDYLNIRETGYIDATGLPTTPTSTRLFFNNVQELSSLRPGLSLALTTGDMKKNWISAAVTYAPVMFISLTQDFSSETTPTIAGLDTLRTEKTFSGTGTNAWDAAVEAGTLLGPVELSCDVQFDSASYVYKMLAIGGGTTSMDLIKQNIKANFLVSSPKVRFGSLQPRIGVGVVHSRYEDNNESSNNEDSTDWRFSFGFVTR